MENRIIALVAEHLLNEQFRSKKQMANALGLQYRTLLNACSGTVSYTHLDVYKRQPLSAMSFLMTPTLWI